MTDLITKLPRPLARRLFSVVRLQNLDYLVRFVPPGQCQQPDTFITVPRDMWLTDASVAHICLTVP